MESYFSNKPMTRRGALSLLAGSLLFPGQVLARTPRQGLENTPEERIARQNYGDYAHGIKAERTRKELEDELSRSTPSAVVDGSVKVDKLLLGTLIPERTFIFTEDGYPHKNFPHSYISLGNPKNNYQLTIGCLEGDGTDVRPLTGSRWGGLELSDEDSTILQAVRGYLTVRDRSRQGLIPEILFGGSFRIIAGNNVIGYDKGKADVFIRENARLNGNPLGSSAPFLLRHDPDSTERLPHEIYVGNNNTVVKVNPFDGKIYRTLPGNYDYDYISTGLGFNRLSAEEEKVYREKTGRFGSEHMKDSVEELRDFIRF